MYRKYYTSILETLNYDMYFNLELIKKEEEIKKIELNTCGDKVKYYRLLNNMSQKELASKTNKSKTTIVQIENNIIPLTLKSCEKIADALNIDERLLYDDYLEFINYDYPNKLKNLRLKMGLNIKDFAEKLHITPVVYRRWENDINILSRVSFSKLISIFNSV